MSGCITPDRRRFSYAAAAGMTAKTIPTSAIAAQAGPTKSASLITAGSNTFFTSPKQIEAGLLSVGYAEVGPADGSSVILPLVWPYDIHSFVDVAPLLALKGYRVIVPYPRGSGSTRFISNETFRNGQPSAVTLDIIALMDALKIEKASAYAKRFSSRYEHRLIRGGIGHNLPQEVPQAFAEAIIDIARS